MHIRQFLDEKRKLHSKSIYLKPFKAKPQEYLLSRNLSIQQIQTLIQLRSHMLVEAKLNFKGLHGENIWCEICNIFPSSQKHIFTCFEIRKEAKIISDKICYSHVDGSLEEQENFTKIYTYLLDIRRTILERRNPLRSREGHSTEDLNNSLFLNFHCATEIH